MREVSPIRLYALRAAYLLNFVGGLVMFWPALFNPATPLGEFEGFAFSLWAGLTGLMGLGLRYPLQMLPLLFMQLFYKTLWMLAVARPLWSSGQWNASVAASFRVFLSAMVVDVLVIPWGYVFRNYVKKPGESWSYSRNLRARATSQ